MAFNFYSIRGYGSDFFNIKFSLEYLSNLFYFLYTNLYFNKLHKNHRIIIIFNQ